MSSIIEDLKKEQESTTEEVKRLRLEFSSFFDAEKSKSLQLLEALREKKDDTDDIMVSSSSSSDSDMSSSKSMFSGLFDSLGKKILAGIAAAGIAAAIKTGFTDAINELMDRFPFGGPDPDPDPEKDGLDIDASFLARGAGLLAPTLAPKAIAKFDQLRAQYKAYNASQKAKLPKPFAPSGTLVDAQGKPIGGAAPNKPPTLDLPAGTKPPITAAPNKPPLLSASTVKMIAKGAATMTGEAALKVMPVAGTVTAGAFALEKFSEGDITGGIIQLVTAYPGLGAGASLGVGTVGLIRDAYLQEYGTTPEDDVFVDLNGTTNRLIAISKEVGRQITPDPSGAFNDNGIGRRNLSQFGGVSGGIKKINEDVKSARIAAWQKDLDLNTQGNGIPSDAMIAPVNISVQGGGNGGGNGGGGNPPMQNPTESTGSVFLDAQNSALSSPLMMFGR